MKVSKEFWSHFKKVTTHYQFTPADIEEAKDGVRRNYEGAKVSFAALASEIKEGA